MPSRSILVPEPLQSLVGPQERRAFPRYPCRVEASCRTLSGGRSDKWTGLVRNVSRGGVGLRLGRRFERGTLLVLELGDAEQGFSNILARVAHTSREEGEWLLGCAFLRQLGPAVLEACGALAVQPEQPNDRRAWVRSPCHLQSICGREGVPQGWPAEVTNISPGGLGLVLAHRPEKGELLQVELPEKPGGSPVPLPVRVMQVQQRPDGQWLVGCEFARQLGEKELRGLSR